MTGKVQSLKDYLESAYLDWVNNYLTIEVMASSYEVSAHLMRAMVSEGGGIHHEKHGIDCNKFIDYLRGTLIPALKEAEMHSTAKDFQTCILLMKSISKP